MTTPHDKAEMFADLLAQLINDHHAGATPVRRTMTNAGSEMIVTEFDGQTINIIITPARRSK